MSSITNFVKKRPLATGLIALGIAAIGYFGYRRYQQIGPHWDSSVNGHKFHAAITAAKTHNIAQEKTSGTYLTKQSKQHGAYVHSYSASEYSKMKLFLLNNGSKKGVAGVAVKNGDIVSVFKHPDCRIKGIVDRYLIPKAIQNGGNRLDCFDGFLPTLYARNGFKPVSKMPFNKKFAPPDWNYKRDGTPDIIFMKHTTET